MPGRFMIFYDLGSVWRTNRPSLSVILWKVCSCTSGATADPARRWSSSASTNWPSLATRAAFSLASHAACLCGTIFSSWPAISCFTVSISWWDRVVIQNYGTMPKRGPNRKAVAGAMALAEDNLVNTPCWQADSLGNRILRYPHVIEEGLF